METLFDSCYWNHKIDISYDESSLYSFSIISFDVTIWMSIIILY